VLWHTTAAELAPVWLGVERTCTVPLADPAELVNIRDALPQVDPSEEI